MDDREEKAFERDAQGHFSRSWPLYAAVIAFSAALATVLLVREPPRPHSDVPFSYDRARDLATIGRLWDETPVRTQGDCPGWDSLVGLAPELGAAWIDARARDFVAMERGVRC